MELECYNFSFRPAASSPWLPEPELVAQDSDVGETAIHRPTDGTVGRFVRTKFAGRAPKAYFDGGLRKIGFVIYSPEGELEYARGRSDPAWMTNNVAELNALLECIRYLASEAGL